MKKLSVSLDDDLADRAALRAEEAAGGNLSLLTAVALRRILEVPGDELVALVGLERFDRRAPSRDFWMQAFWEVLADLMGRPEMKTAFDNPLVPRQFGEFYAVLLLNHVGRYDDENDPFFPHIGPMPVKPGSPPPFQWTFDRSVSPVAAARAVASKLKEYGVEVATPQRG
jgi:hypothetical protein